MDSPSGLICNVLDKRYVEPHFVHVQSKYANSIAPPPELLHSAELTPRKSDYLHSTQPMTTVLSDFF